jgi:Fic family protein
VSKNIGIKIGKNMNPPVTNIDAMEPMLPEQSSRELDDVAVDLVAKANSLTGQINPIVTRSIGHLVRSMNCYYSNFIEGHNTRPLDIDRALHKDLSVQPEQRNLQLEAVAHIEVQEAIDEGKDDRSVPLTGRYACWLHQEFCRRLPDEMLWVEDRDSKRKIRVIPGALRDGEVQVGNHVPPAAAALPRFLTRFDEAYNPNHLSKVRQIVAIAAAHHRFVWIHPFYDGNGRVTRLMSHAMLLRLDIGSSLWSVARGLARNVSRYKTLLHNADQPRQTDYDGGVLSQGALIAFCRFFLETCVDQVSYMRSILEPTQLLRRMEIYTEEEVRAGHLLKGSFALLREALFSGEYERGQAGAITGLAERTARDVLSALVERRLLVSDTPKSAVRLGFPVDVIERWFPSLYPTTQK